MDYRTADGFRVLDKLSKSDREVERLRAGFALCLRRLSQNRSFDTSEASEEIEAYCQAAEKAKEKA